MVEPAADNQEGNFQKLIENSTIDFGRRSQDYADHRPGLPPSFYDRIETFCKLQGANVLDLGTGPGIVALKLAERGANVVGIDITSNQIEAAKQKAKELHLDSKTKFLVATAEETKQEDGVFDLVTAGQCWPWFKHDIAMKEIRRVLKPNGVLVIGHFCYLPQRSKLAEETEELVLKKNPSYSLMAGFDGLYPKQIDQLIRGDFYFLEQFCYDHEQYFSHQAWRGRMRTCNGVGSGTLTEKEVQSFDQELADLLIQKYPKEPVMVWHRVWGVVARNVNNK